MQEDSFKEPIDCENYRGCSPPPECWDQEESSKEPNISEEKKEEDEPVSSEDLKTAQQHPQPAGCFITLVLLLLSYLLFGRPLRRILLVRHYREPLAHLSNPKN